jgi:SAM-dependent methyltransferase
MSSEPFDRMFRRPIARGRRWWPLLALLVLAGAGSYVAGTRVGKTTAGATPPATSQAAPTHPLTGRRIAGIATDPHWCDRPEREREENPEKALDLIGIIPGMVVADVGAGSGYMTVRLARRIGPKGLVYANDVQPAMLQVMHQKIEAQHLSHVRLVQGTPDDARLPEGAIDLALLVDVYHELQQPQRMLQSIRRALKPDGRLVLIEYRKEDPTLPIAEEHRMSVSDARIEVDAEGFTFDRAIEDLPRQHILIFRPSTPPA